MFKGAFTALVTPYKEGKIDLEALRSLVDWQIREGINMNQSWFFRNFDTFI